MSPMRKVDPSEVLDLVAYEKARDAMRARVIERKKHRRVAVGENVTLLFEDRETVLFQIQEMVRTERIVQPERIREEVDVYNALVPDAGELSATLFIEIPELARMSAEQVRAAVDRFRGLDEPGVVRLEVGGHRVPARFEGGHTHEEKMAAVHYLRFAVPEAARAALPDAGVPARLVVEHPSYRASADLPAAVRAELAADLA